MNIDIAELLDSIRKRVSSEQLGIGVAASYLKAFAPCLSGDDACPLTAVGFNEPGDWQKALQDAESRMTYCAPDLAVKGVRKEAAVPGAIAAFDHLVTSTRTDRDGDILEAKGAEIDENMPLLWHHNIAAPLGPYLGTKSQNEKYISGASAILDTSLGRDAAVLAEGGALRISNGFKPIEAEPIMGKGHIVVGFHVKRYRIMEVSLVSVPSNTDAVITAFSRKQLEHPLVTKWAGNLYADRRKSFPGFTLDEKAEVTAPDGKCRCGSRCKCKPAEDTPTAAEKPATVEGTKKAGDVVTGGVSVASEGRGSVGVVKYSLKCSACGGFFDLTGVPSGMDLAKISCPFCGGTSATSGEASSGSGSETNLGPDVVVNGNKAADDLATKVGATYSKKTKGCMSRMSKCLKGAVSELRGMMEEAGLSDDDEKAIESLIHKSHEPESRKLYGMSDNMEGSHQWITERLYRSLSKYMQANISDLSEGYFSVVATFDDTAIVSHMPYRSNDASFYQIDWSAVNGQPTWSGTPTPVKLSVQVERKLAAGILTGAAGIRNMAKMISAQAIGSDREAAIAALSEVKGQVSESLGLLVDQRDSEEFAKVFG